MGPAIKPYSLPKGSERSYPGILGELLKSQQPPANRGNARKQLAPPRRSSGPPGIDREASRGVGPRLPSQLQGRYKYHDVRQEPKRNPVAEPRVGGIETENGPVADPQAEGMLLNNPNLPTFRTACDELEPQLDALCERHPITSDVVKTFEAIVNPDLMRRRPLHGSIFDGYQAMKEMVSTLLLLLDTEPHDQDNLGRHLTYMEAAIETFASNLDDEDPTLPSSGSESSKEVDASISTFNEYERKFLEFLEKSANDVFFEGFPGEAKVDVRTTALDVGDDDKSYTTTLRTRRTDIAKGDSAPGDETPHRRDQVGAILPISEQPSGSSASGVKWKTWYNFWFTNISLLGIWKFVASSGNQSDLANKLDLALGCVFAIITFWLAIFRDHPKIAPLFDNDPLDDVKRALDHMKKKVAEMRCGGGLAAAARSGMDRIVQSLVGALASLVPYSSANPIQGNQTQTSPTVVIPFPTPDTDLSVMALPQAPPELGPAADGTSSQTMPDPVINLPPGEEDITSYAERTQEYKNC